jgi:hypothetical protein
VVSGKWTDGCVQAVAGREIIILQDNDDAGKKKTLDALKLCMASRKPFGLCSCPV